jgi:hypothetical protein
MLMKSILDTSFRRNLQSRVCASGSSRDARMSLAGRRLGWVSA